VRRPKPRIFDHYLYIIQLDKDGSRLNAVHEDALEAIDSSGKLNLNLTLLV